MTQLEPRTGSQLQPDNEAPEFVQRGKVLIVQRDFQEAVKVCRLGLLAHPSCVEGRLVLAMALMALRRHDDVLAEMRVALDMDPNNAMSYLLRGEALFYKGELHHARDALLQAQQLDPLNDKADKLLGELERRIDPRDSVPAQHSASTKVYPASAAQRLPPPEDTSGASIVSVLSAEHPGAVSMTDVAASESEPAALLDDDSDDEGRTEVDDPLAIAIPGSGGMPPSASLPPPSRPASRGLPGVPEDEQSDRYATAPWLAPRRAASEVLDWAESTATEPPDLLDVQVGESPSGPEPDPAVRPISSAPVEHPALGELVDDGVSTAVDDDQPSSAELFDDDPDLLGRLAGGAASTGPVRQSGRTDDPGGLAASHTGDRAELYPDPWPPSSDDSFAEPSRQPAEPESAQTSPSFDDHDEPTDHDHDPSHPLDHALIDALSGSHEPPARRRPAPRHATPPTGVQTPSRLDDAPEGDREESSPFSAVARRDPDGTGEISADAIELLPDDEEDVAGATGTPAPLPDLPQLTGSRRGVRPSVVSSAYPTDDSDPGEDEGDELETRVRFETPTDDDEASFDAGALLGQRLGALDSVAGADPLSANEDAIGAPRQLDGPDGGRPSADLDDGWDDAAFGLSDQQGALSASPRLSGMADPGPPEYLDDEPLPTYEDGGQPEAPGYLDSPPGAPLPGPAARTPPPALEVYGDVDPGRAPEEYLDDGGAAHAPEFLDERPAPKAPTYLGSELDGRPDNLVGGSEDAAPEHLEDSLAPNVPEQLGAAPAAPAPEYLDGAPPAHAPEFLDDPPPAHAPEFFDDAPPAHAPEFLDDPPPAHAPEFFDDAPPAHAPEFFDEDGRSPAPEYLDDGARPAGAPEYFDGGAPAGPAPTYLGQEGDPGGPQYFDGGLDEPAEHYPDPPPEYLDESEPGAQRARAELPLRAGDQADAFSVDDPPLRIDEELDDRAGADQSLWSDFGRSVADAGGRDRELSIPAEPDSAELAVEEATSFGAVAAPVRQPTASLHEQEDGRAFPYLDDGSPVPGGPLGDSRDGRRRGARPRTTDDAQLRASQRRRIDAARARGRGGARQRPRTTWMTLMLGETRKQRWIRGAFGAGMIVLALGGGFLFRYLRIGHQIEKKRKDAFEQLRRGNLADYQLAASRLGEIVASKSELQWANAALARINWSIPFEFGDPNPRLKPARAGAPESDENWAAVRILAKLSQSALDEAARLASSARKTHSKSALLHYLAGRIALLRGSTEAAMTFLTLASELRPRDATILAGLGNALLSRGRSEAALDAFKRALTINPEHVASLLGQARYWIEAGKLDRADSVLKRLVGARSAASGGQRAWANLLLARVQLQRGHLARATSYLREARTSPPVQDAVFYDSIADLLIELFKLGEAEKFTKRSLRVLPGRPHPRYHQARIYLRQGRPDAALRALKQSRNLRAAHVLKARILLDLGKVAVARREIEQALKRGADLRARITEALVRAAEGDRDQAESRLRGLLAKHPASAPVLTALGDVLLQKGEVVEARKKLERAASRDGNALDARRKLAEVLLREGKFEQAHKTLLELVKRRPWYLPAKKALAKLDLGSRNLPEARSALREILAKVPADADARLALVEVLTEQRAYDAALAELGKLKDSSPGAKALAKGRLALAREHAKQAIEQLDKAREKLTNDPRPWLLLLGAQLFDNKIDAAKSTVRKMAKKFPKLPETYEARGILELQGMARPSSAIRSFSKALKQLSEHGRHPRVHARIQVLLGRSYHEDGQTNEALNWYEKAKNACPRCPEPLFREGLAFDELRRTSEAIDAIKHALSQDAKFRQAYYELGKIYENANRRDRAIAMYQKYLALHPPKIFADEVKQAIANLRAE